MNIPGHVEPKFDECQDCAFYGRSRICRQCDAGECFEPNDGPPPLDKVITDD